MAIRLPFDSLVLMCVVRDAQKIIGCYLKRVAQLDEFTPVLRFGKSGTDFTLLISANPSRARMHLCGSFTACAAPTGFARAIKDRCDNARIVSIRQVGFDRIVEIGFEGRGGCCRLVAELFGTRANAYLLDGSGRIAARARRIGTQRIGDAYTFPPVPSASLEEALRTKLGLSPILRTELESSTSEQILERIRLGPPVVCASAGAFPFAPTSLPGAQFEQVETISEGLERYWQTAADFDDARAIESRLRTQLARAAEQKRRALHQMLATVEEARQSHAYQMKGELILAFAHELEGRDTLDTVDYDGSPIRIPLDPQLSPPDNAVKLFKKAKKAKHGAETVSAQIPRLEGEILELDDVIRSLTHADIDALRKAEKTAKDRGWLRLAEATESDSGKPAFGGKKISATTDARGYSILWGENAEANEHLTTRIASPTDIWLHVRANSGSHVVIRTNGHPEKVQPDTLQAAARIAVLHSAVKHGKHVPVDYTLVKHVRRQRKAAPGQVVYSREKTIFVDGL